MGLNLDWKAIHPYGGSQDAAFEELCAQLARAESPDDAKFIRKGSPDAGVECFCVLPDSSEWGWQAKYFDGLGTSQWTQIDASVETALNKHPNLVRYYVCIPIDLPDARVKGQKSALDRWGEHVRKWQLWACTRGMRVDFVWWGASELLERLSKPEHAGRVAFWFGELHFDDEWFQRRFEEAREVAGPRYTPELNIDLPIASDLELFGRSDVAFDSIKSLARGIRSQLSSLRYLDSHERNPKAHSSLNPLLRAGEDLLSALSEIASAPTGPLPFGSIVTKIEKAMSTAQQARAVQSQLAREFDTERQDGKQDRRYYNNPFENTASRIFNLNYSLSEALSKVRRANEFCSSDLMILAGDAGTGKTHLLCDLASSRLAASAPTLLLMGQRFLSADEPWIQALDQLDARQASTEEFVGALESAAQAANCRALVLIDALNEGNGRAIWRAHLPPFLQHLKRSPWIGVVLSVRTTYEDIVIPAQVKQHAVRATHYGFTDVGYEAMQQFFQHYGIEYPSVPLLNPEFHNPLFLKTICEGLRGLELSRLPTGFQGITKTFELYLESMNVRLAESLDYDPSDNLVLEALDSLADHMVARGKRWLLRRDARRVVDSVLRGRGFQDSLYGGLLSEGALVQDMGWAGESPDREVTYIAYERFADHIVANRLLEENVDPRDPSAAFKAEGGLAFLSDHDSFVPSGLLEALCVQVPEHTGQELFRLAPALRDDDSLEYIAGEAFRKSIVWRSLSAFTDATHEVLNEMVLREHDWEETIDLMLTVSTIDNHPFNAECLNRHLRSLSMPDRDAQWSVYLHSNWRSEGSAHRLVRWASEMWAKDRVDDRSVELAAVALGWTLTSSDRFLRDRATKALVSLLTGRLNATARFVKRFHDVDDPYVAERIYAVAYGVSLRSHDGNGVERLADVVYECAFASGYPPTHILLRDYARGVIERAIVLGSEQNFDGELFRPPYHSRWPSIPTEAEVNDLVSQWTSDEQRGRRNPVVSSVMHGDFATYVLRTDWGHSSTSWLSLRRTETPWRSLQERKQLLVSQLDRSQAAIWRDLVAREEHLSNEASDRARKASEAARMYIEDQRQASEDDSLSIQATSGEKMSMIEALLRSAHVSSIEEPIQEDREWKTILHNLRSSLPNDLRIELDEVIDSRTRPNEQPPRFDLAIVQRYILGRVKELGWTDDRFGDFDRYLSRSRFTGREAAKPERIGKKYQWIAYHEILAYMSDHYQYRHRYDYNTPNQSYDGPWQDNFRDIDPSCMVESTDGDSSSAWWHFDLQSDWGDSLEHREWIRRKVDLPDIKELLIATRSGESANWVIVDSSFTWAQPTPAGYDTYDIARREIWYICMPYLVRSEDVDKFVKWSNGVDFYGRWMPERSGDFGMFLGEHGWSDAYRYCERQSEVWCTPEHGCPAQVQVFGTDYVVETGFDCSIDDSYRLKMPHYRFISSMDLKWSGRCADYQNCNGDIVAFDPAAWKGGPSALLIREDVLKNYLVKEGLDLCWVVLGEKLAIGGKATERFQGALRVSGLCRLRDGGPEGLLKCTVQDPHD